MNSTTIKAFGDELTKIAIWDATLNALRTGWHGPDESTARGAELLHNPATGDPELKQTWMGHGRIDQIGAPGSKARAIGEARYKAMGRGGKALENVMSLGGLTKHLPVGTKSLMLAGTAAMVPGALKKDDPQGRSRAERVAGLAGSTVGGLLGVGAMLNSGRFGAGMSNLAGGVGGSMLGERLFTAPWRHRRERMQRMQAMQAQQQPQPGMVAMSPYGAAQ